MADDSHARRAGGAGQGRHHSAHAHGLQPGDSRARQGGPGAGAAPWSRRATPSTTHGFGVGGSARTCARWPCIRVLEYLCTAYACLGVVYTCVVLVHLCVACMSVCVVPAYRCGAYAWSRRACRPRPATPGWSGLANDSHARRRDHTQRSRWTAPAAAHGDSLTWRTLGVVSPGVPPKACHAGVARVGERLACASRRRVGQGRHSAHAHGLPPGDSRARQGGPGAGLRRGLAGRPRARRMDLAWAAARARARGGARRTGGTRLPVGATAGRALPHVCCWIHLSTDETTSPVHLCAARGSSRWARVMTEGCWSRRISLTHGCQPCSVATGR